MKIVLIYSRLINEAAFSFPIEIKSPEDNKTIERIVKAIAFWKNRGFNFVDIKELHLPESEYKQKYLRTTLVPENYINEFLDENKKHYQSDNQLNSLKTNKIREIINPNNSSKESEPSIENMEKTASFRI
jgi:hypothetical protein